MWVYGDHVRTVAPRAALAAVADALATLPPGPDRAGALLDTFVDAAATAQALLDAAFEARGGADARSPLGDALAGALTGLARTLLDEAPPDPAPWRALASAASAAPAAPVAARLAESFAFYALDPRVFAATARAAGLGPDATVIGVRSIGVALAAVVAAAVGAPPPLTVRPVGDPFARRLVLAPALRAELAAARGPVAVVDEGPGLSGSSFLAVADALAEAGVGRERLVLLPSHPEGPGAHASPAARALFAAARTAAPLLPDAAEVAARFADLVGPPLEPPVELGGGPWRERVHGREADWPAVNPTWERRKVFVRSARGAFLLRWAGLGAEARDKLDRARRLAEAGLAPPVTALREGWLVAPWIEGRPLGPADPPPLAELAAALRLRAGWPAPDRGASRETLAEMARFNVGEALGPAVGARAAEGVAAGLAGPAPPAVWTDARLHRHEWLLTRDSRILKTDALDHARAHDLVGAQEIGWDVAGAAAEWDLAPAQVAALAAAAGAPPARLPGLELAYLAFQLGVVGHAAAGPLHHPGEGARLQRERDRYATRLERRLRG